MMRWSPHRHRPTDSNSTPNPRIVVVIVSIVNRTAHTLIHRIRILWNRRRCYNWCGHNRLRHHRSGYNWRCSNNWLRNHHWRRRGCNHTRPEQTSNAQTKTDCDVTSKTMIVSVRTEARCCNSHCHCDCNDDFLYHFIVYPLLLFTTVFTYSEVCKLLIFFLHCKSRTNVGCESVIGLGYHLKKKPIHQLRLVCHPFQCC